LPKAAKATPNGANRIGKNGLREPPLNAHNTARPPKVNTNEVQKAFGETVTRRAR
jgi:hypothetical protein